MLIYIYNDFIITYIDIYTYILRLLYNLYNEFCYLRHIIDGNRFVGRMNILHPGSDDNHLNILTIEDISIAATTTETILHLTT